MSLIKITEDINHPRRRFLGTAAMAITAAQFGNAKFREGRSSK